MIYIVELSGRPAINILIGGDRNQFEFYSAFLTNNGYEITLFPEIFPDISQDDSVVFGVKSQEKPIEPPKQTIKKDVQLCAAVIFMKTGILVAEDEIKEITKNYKNKLPILAVIENNKFDVIDRLYSLGVNEICFDFKPEAVLEELNSLKACDQKSKDIITDEKDVRDETSKHYIINFFENKNIFVVDVHGPLIKEKIAPLKLMFENLIKLKLNKIRGVIYILTDIHEDTMVFDNVWTLFHIWNELGYDYKKVTYLTNSDNAIRRINKYFSQTGIKHFINLLEVTEYLYPELSKKGEDEIFNFASQLLQEPKKVYTQ